MKFCHSSIYRFAGSDAVGIVSIRNSVGSLAYACQPPAVLPGEGEAVTVDKGISDLIIGDGLTVKAGQQVFPARVRVAVGSPLPFRWTPCWSVQNLYSRPN